MKQIHKITVQYLNVNKVYTLSYTLCLNLSGHQCPVHHVMTDDFLHSLILLTRCVKVTHNCMVNRCDIICFSVAVQYILY